MEFQHIKHSLLWIIISYLIQGNQGCFRKTPTTKSKAEENESVSYNPHGEGLPLVKTSEKNVKVLGIQNGDFEGPLFEYKWHCEGCLVTKSSLAYSGKYSALVIPVSTNASLYQNIVLKPGGRYVVGCMIRLDPQASAHVPHQINLKLHIKYEGEEKYVQIARLPKLRSDQGWQKLAGDIMVQNIAVKEVSLQVQSADKGVRYHVDKMSVRELIPDPQWRDKADHRIDMYRKNNITFRFNISSGLDPKKIQLMVNLTKHDFPFGSAIEAKLMYDTSKETSYKYRHFFMNLFNFAVPENALKWNIMEPQQGKIDFETADKALAVLASQNISVRGHCILWDVTRHEPSWLLPLNASQIKEQVHHRMNYVVPHYRNKVVHWDVNNEDLHDSFFEVKVHDPEYMVSLFHMARDLDPNVHLFMNDFQVVSEGTMTQAYVNLAHDLVSGGAPIYGLGLQSHVQGPIPDITLLQERLDTLASTGLALWITEMDIDNKNQTEKAQGYEDLYRMYYSHPAVHGVLMWGFWDKAHWRPGAAIVQGDDFKLNAAGVKVTQLIKENWSTHTILQPHSASDVQEMRGFHGLYNMTVLYEGRQVASETFYLSKGTDLQLNVNVTP